MTTYYKLLTLHGTYYLETQDRWVYFFNTTNKIWTCTYHIPLEQKELDFLLSTYTSDKHGTLKNITAEEVAIDIFA